MAKAKAKTPSGEFNGFRVGDVGVKVGGMVYAAGSVIPKDLVTDELSPYLVWEANVEDTPGETPVEENAEGSETPVEGSDTAEGESL